MTSRRGAVRGELLRFFSAAPDGSPLSGPDPLPPYEDGYNRIYDLLSRGCDEIAAPNQVQGAADTSKVSEDSQAIYGLLPLILLRIFGYRPGSGWLETGADLTHRDRDALMRLVLPNGPVHNFCQYHSTINNSNSNNRNNNEVGFVYEFPISNLPAFAQAELRGGSAGGQSLASRSALEPLLRKTLRESNPSLLFLTPMQYFELCLVSSAAQKWTEMPRSGGVRRTQKRSSSLPSVRAMYNKVIGAYAELLIVDEVLGSSGSLLLPACIDMFCLPWANSLVAGMSYPRPSTQSVDAVSALVLAMIPKTDAQAMVRGGSGSFSWNEMSNGTAMYRAVEILLDAVFQRYNTKDPSTTFASYVRLFALYLAPWKRSIRGTMSAGLFPKKRGASAASKRASLKSTISNTYEQLKVASGVGVDANAETSVSQDRLRYWRSKVGGDRRGEEGKLLMLCTIRSANQRLAGSADGYRALALVGEAVSASGTKYIEGAAGSESDAEREGSRRAEAKGCLEALREQSIEGESRSGIKAKAFTVIFGTALDIRVDAGGLFGFGEKMGVPASPGNNTPVTPRYVQRRKSALMNATYLQDKVEILGSVWDRPISESENEAVVLAMFRLAMLLEPYTYNYAGIRLDRLRALGRYDNIIFGGVALLFMTSTFRLIRSLL